GSRDEHHQLAASTAAVGRVRRGPRARLLPLVFVAAFWFVVTNRYHRWTGELHEFGTGIVDMFFPIRASTFVAEHKLPAPLYNDLTTGGYLAYARPVPGGVYIDGRLEVYDVDFYADYMATLDNPSRWQAEADRRGIQTVVFFHWWPHHAPLGRFL